MNVTASSAPSVAARPEAINQKLNQMPTHQRMMTMVVTMTRESLSMKMVIAATPAAPSEKPR
jgi:hypothetical protein